MEYETSVLECILNGEEDPKDLPLSLLKRITNDFSEERKIGQGGFGEVYKGELGNKIVAVKRMYVNEHTVDDRAFRREINSLMKTKHTNVVRFLGFCSHTYHKLIKEPSSDELTFVKVNERLLCLEFISNGSLDKHITSTIVFQLKPHFSLTFNVIGLTSAQFSYRDRKCSIITDELRGLKWGTRYEIITGICMGMHYLHEDINIIHMDLKPPNILLDDRMVPKITDFGLSRSSKISRTMGLRFGTQGYFAPEYGTLGRTSSECDIYSLGAIITELVTGRMGVPNKNNVLRRWRHRWNNPPTQLQYQQVIRCIEIARHCREQNPGDRPSIKEIMNILGKSTDEYTCQFPSLLKNDLDENIKSIEGLLEEARITLSIEKDLLGGSGSVEHGPNATAENREKEGARLAGKVTGRDDVRDRIMRMLENDDNPSSSDTCLSVIGIHGIPGSGKTTLARYIFKAAKTSGYFDLFMWIHVFAKFRVDTIFMEMIEQAYEKNDPCPKYNSLDALARKLEKVLDNKRFLLVLDDVWCSKEVDQKKLSELIPPLMNANRGSKILVTGRLQDAIYELGPEVEIIDNSKIPELDDKFFLELFMHHAFGHKSEVERYRPLITVGTRIAQKLKKSPLLAKAVGGVLCKKQDLCRWQSFEKQKIWEKHMGPLLWCYQHLDEQVKQCFAYCSIFPRGHHLYRDDLVNLWVAEGFISTTDKGWEMECVSQDCFHELLSVSFLQPGGKDELDDKYFVIHDLLYDLTEMVAGSDCFRIENGSPKAPSDVRHLSIERCSASMIIEDIVKLKNLRTLIIFHGEDDVNDEVLDKIFMELTKLRVLIFQTVKLECESLSIPGSINCLKHLRYLGLRFDRVHILVLLGTIVELYLLQVFDFGIVNGVDIEVPIDLDVTSLVNVRHVVSSMDVPFPNIGRLTSLQTLPILNVAKGQGYELHQLGVLNNLRGQLSIWGLEHVNSKEEALQAKLADKQVTSLSLNWNSRASSSPEVQADVLEGLCPPESLEYMRISSYEGSRYPEWMFGPENSTMYLHTLHLNWCGKLVPAPTPELYFAGVTCLDLCECDWDSMPYNMEHLTDLLFSGSRCEKLPDNMDQLTSLKRLIIKHCRRFRTIPALPTSLQYFELEGCHEDLSMSCKDEDHPNYKAIEHIPEKHIVGRCFAPEELDEEWGAFMERMNIPC